MRNLMKLTNREKEVLDLLIAGMKNREIAEYLHISDNTVETHLTHIYDKLNVRNRVEAIIRALTKK